MYLTDLFGLHLQVKWTYYSKSLYLGFSLEFIHPY